MHGGSWLRYLTHGALLQRMSTTPRVSRVSLTAFFYIVSLFFFDFAEKKGLLVIYVTKKKSFLCGCVLKQFFTSVSVNRNRYIKPRRTSLVKNPSLITSTSVNNCQMTWNDTRQRTNRLLLSFSWDLRRHLTNSLSRLSKSFPFVDVRINQLTRRPLKYIMAGSKFMVSMH